MFLTIKFLNHRARNSLAGNGHALRVTRTCSNSPSPLSELHACSSVPARGEGSGVSHNSGVAWDVEGQNSRGGKTRVARASQVSRKSQLFRDTLLVLPGRLCSQNGISLRCRFLVLKTTTACVAKKASEVSRLRSKTLRLSGFIGSNLAKARPVFLVWPPGLKVQFWPR